MWITVILSGISLATLVIMPLSLGLLMPPSVLQTYQPPYSNDYPGQ